MHHATSSLPRSDLSPVWTSIVWAVAALWANWVWGSWFSRARDVEITLLAMASLLGWPLMVALVGGLLSYAVVRLDGLFWAGAVIVLGTLGAGVAVYGIPGPWSLVLCAAFAGAMGWRALRDRQDDADLEDL